jgi:hypothetical protein
LAFTLHSCSRSAGATLIAEIRAMIERIVE